MNLKKAHIFTFIVLLIAGGRASSGYDLRGLPAEPAVQAYGANMDQGKELLRLTNQSRIAHGLLPLIVDAKLTKIAQEHAEEMARQGYISHDLSAGNISVRADRSGYNYETVRENIARARSAAQAHSDLLKSPGHKANILAADVTRIGIGIAKGDTVRYSDYLYIAEVFASPRNEYEPSQIKELLTIRVEKLRKESMAAMEQDSIFDKMASDSLRVLRDSYTGEDLRNILAKSVNELNESGKAGISRLDISVQRLSNPDWFSVPDAIRQGLTGMYGTAVRRIMDKDNRPAFLVLTLVGISR
jgi:hypothetical protein